MGQPLSTCSPPPCPPPLFLRPPQDLCTSSLSSSSTLTAPLPSPAHSETLRLLEGRVCYEARSPPLLGSPEAAHLDCVSVLPSCHEQLLHSEFRNQC